MEMKIHQHRFVRSIAFAVLALAVTLGVIPAPASASTISECQALIAALRSETETVIIVGKNAEKNRAGLNHHSGQRFSFARPSEALRRDSEADGLSR